MNSKRILFLSPIPTHPQTAGNRTRVAAMLQALIDLGHDVTFLFVRHEPGDEAAMRAAWGARFIATDWQRQAIPLLRRIKRKLIGRISPDARHALDIDEWYDPALDAVLRTLSEQRRFEVVLCNYVFFSRSLNIFDSGVRKLIDTHDAFANRHRQYLARGEAPQWFSTSEAGENRAFARADTVLAIQETERQAFAARTTRPVVTISHITEVSRLSDAKVVPGRMLLIASNNPINVHAVTWFLETVLQDVRKQFPVAHLALGGAICSAIPDQPGLIKLGRVESLVAEYEKAAVVINPVQFMTGLSIKNLEALGYGRALVSAPAGLRGMEDGRNSAFLSAEGAAEFTGHCVRLLSDDSFRTALSAAALDYITRCNEAVRGQLQQVVAG